MSEWRLVDENTPRDGTQIIVGWADPDDDRVEVVTWHSYGMYYANGGPSIDDDDLPTHWQTMPEPPR